MDSVLDVIRETARADLDTDEEIGYFEKSLAKWVSGFNDDFLQVAIDSTAQDAPFTATQAGGVIHGVLSTLMFMGLKEREAVWEIIKRLPNNFRLRTLPASFIHHDADWNYLEPERSRITPFKGLYDQLPDYVTDEQVIELKEKYIWECALISGYAKRDAKKPECYLWPFREAGSQMIAEFEVRDLHKENDPNKVNWHLQNTSQWVYAGCILYDKKSGRVSTHH
jgi:hypothetical protein